MPKMSCSRYKLIYPSACMQTYGVLDDNILQDVRNTLQPAADTRARLVFQG